MRISAINADDEMIDSLSAVNPRCGEPLRELLAAWRHEIHAAPIRSEPDIDTAIRAITESRPPQRESGWVELWVILAVVIAAGVLLTWIRIGVAL